MNRYGFDTYRVYYTREIGTLSIPIPEDQQVEVSDETATPVATHYYEYKTYSLSQIEDLVTYSNSIVAVERID